MSAAVPVLTALLLAAFAGILLQRYSPACALLLSLGAAVWLLPRLAQPLRGVLQAMVQLGQRTNAQAFFCLLLSKRQKKKPIKSTYILVNDIHFWLS